MVKRITNYYEGNLHGNSITFWEVRNLIPGDVNGTIYYPIELKQFNHGIENGISLNGKVGLPSELDGRRLDNISYFQVSYFGVEYPENRKIENGKEIITKNFKWGRDGDKWGLISDYDWYTNNVYGVPIHWDEMTDFNADIINIIDNWGSFWK